MADNEAKLDLFEKTKENVLASLIFHPRGIIQRQIASCMNTAIKHINYYAKIAKDKKGEADLLHILLIEVFSEYSEYLNTCFTVFDSKLALTTNRLYNKVTKHLHEDYLMEFKDDINHFLSILHAKSNHLDFVYSMPQKVK